MSDKVNTNLEQVVINLIVRTEQYLHNNGVSVLRTGDLNKYFLPEETEKIIDAIEKDAIQESMGAHNADV